MNDKLRRPGRIALLVTGVLALIGATACEPPPQAPTGHLDVVQPRYIEGVLETTVAGWAWDPDTAAPIQVHVYIDGQLSANGPADAPRPDVAAAFPAAGPNHGFEASIGRLDVGAHTVCAYGINVGPEAPNTLLGCADATVPAGLPWGFPELPTGTPPGPVTLTGFALDPDTVGPVDVHLYVDGQATQGVVANLYRAELVGAFPPYGAEHGFGFTVDLPAGPHELCVYAINVGPGYNVLLGCRPV